MSRKKICISMDKELHEKFVQHCKEHGYIVSYRIEALVRKELAS